MRFPLRPFAVAIGLGALSIVACTALPTVSTVPAAGATLDSKFWKDYGPPAKKGTKWTYLETMVNGDKTSTGEYTEEITEVQGDVVTVKITGTHAGVSDPVNETATRSATFDPTTASATESLPFKSEGAVDVKVPYKEFKGAAKVSVNMEGLAMTMYLVPGIGAVKTESTATMFNLTQRFTNELKAFVSP